VAACVQASMRSMQRMCGGVDACARGLHTYVFFFYGLQTYRKCFHHHDTQLVYSRLVQGVTGVRDGGRSIRSCDCMRTRRRRWRHAASPRARPQFLIPDGRVPLPHLPQHQRPPGPGCERGSGARAPLPSCPLPAPNLPPPRRKPMCHQGGRRV